MPKRKRLSAGQKAQIVLEVIREEKSVSEIASENGTHPNQIHKWRKQALENFGSLVVRMVTPIYGVACLVYEARSSAYMEKKTRKSRLMPHMLVSVVASPCEILKSQNFVQLFEDDRKGERVREAEHEQQIEELYAEIGRLSAQLSWLKKKARFIKANKVDTRPLQIEK